MLFLWVSHNFRQARLGSFQGWVCIRLSYEAVGSNCLFPGCPQSLAHGPSCAAQNINVSKGKGRACQ